MIKDQQMVEINYLMPVASRILSNEKNIKYNILYKTIFFFFFTNYDWLFYKMKSITIKIKYFITKLNNS